MKKPIKQSPSALLTSLELWIGFLKTKNQLPLLKQASMTKMKLSALSEAYSKNGQLSAEQEIVFALCVRDYEYIQNQLFNLSYEPQVLLH